MPPEAPTSMPTEGRQLLGQRGLADSARGHARGRDTVASCACTCTRGTRRRGVGCSTAPQPLVWWVRCGCWRVDRKVAEALWVLGRYATRLSTCGPILRLHSNGGLSAWLDHQPVDVKLGRILASSLSLITQRGAARRSVMCGS
jgi:hypothetical protein